MPTRDQGWTLLTTHTHSASLIKHALAVEAAMRAYAAVYQGDADLWGLTGLVHDFDYEEHPTPAEHPLLGALALEGLGWPPDLVEAIKGHGTNLDVPRRTMMAKALFAVDELTGFVAACALVRPDKSIAQLQPSSVAKKWKDRAFARNVSREDMELGAAELGMPLADHIAFVIASLRPVARELGLDGGGEIGH